MSAPTFTPGPWNNLPFGCDAVTGMAGESIYGPDNKRVAEILFGRLKERREHEANARLIAAAPDLFAVCDMITRVTPDSDPVVMFAVVEKARAALAKAAGKGAE